MNPLQLDREAKELIDSFTGLHNKLIVFVKELVATGEAEKTFLIRQKIKDLEQGQNEAEFLALLSEYLNRIERECRKLLLENDLLRYELSYINEKLKIADERLVDLEEMQRQEQFDKEIQSLIELVERNEFVQMIDDSLIIKIENETTDVSLSICEENSLRTKVATTLFAQYLNEGRFEVAVPLCHRVINDRQCSEADQRHEVASMLEILAMAHRDERRFAEAAAMMQHALTIYYETLKANDPVILTTLKNLAQLKSLCDSNADIVANPVSEPVAVELVGTSVGSSVQPSFKQNSKNEKQSSNQKNMQLSNTETHDADHITNQNENSYKTPARRYCGDMENRSLTSECINGARKRTYYGPEDCYQRRAASSEARSLASAHQKAYSKLKCVTAPQKKVLFNDRRVADVPNKFSKCHRRGGQDAWLQGPPHRSKDLVPSQTSARHLQSGCSHPTRSIEYVTDRRQRRLNVFRPQEEQSPSTTSCTWRLLSPEGRW